MTTIVKTFPLLEEILGSWKPVIGTDFDAYRNHLYRMIHFCFFLHPCTGDDKEKIIIAACFHDIGIWSDGTLDYLPPSVARAVEYLAKTGRQAWTEEITLMIDMHHKLQPFDDPRFPLVEVFRKADIADFSMGYIRMGLTADFVAQVQAAFPNTGFHKRLLQLGTKWFLKHPLNPLPFFRL